jgi:hypothetical protein
MLEVILKILLIFGVRILLRVWNPVMGVFLFRLRNVTIVG